MFAQVNSEHCRHKIFNADWRIDGEHRENSLFGMIRNYPPEKQFRDTISLQRQRGSTGRGCCRTVLHRLATTENIHTPKNRFISRPRWRHTTTPRQFLHFPELPPGPGGKSGMRAQPAGAGNPRPASLGTRFQTCESLIWPSPGESGEARPSRIASPLQIMLEGPIGAAAFNNEFGRPNIAGYFRTLETESSQDGNAWGYHKPIMLAGGLGNVRPDHVHKEEIVDGTPIVALGGPTMLIGLGGGAASSVASGSSSESLDFASVQRGNPEMQRRCQEVIDACCAMGSDNPILSIHDVGAGGFCNALPETGA